ncbi:MAG: hypothetical protein ABW007_19455 [Chitinophagaceae bacterium]
MKRNNVSQSAPLSNAIPERNYAIEQRTIVAEWGQFMKANVVRVCDFISRRTLTFGKEWEAIPERHFLNGVFKRTGECITPGLAMSRSTLLRALDSLSLMRDASGQQPVFMELRKIMGVGYPVYFYRLNPNFNPATMLQKPKKFTGPKMLRDNERAEIEAWESQNQDGFQNETRLPEERIDLKHGLRINSEHHKQEGETVSIENNKSDCIAPSPAREVLKKPILRRPLKRQPNHVPPAEVLGEIATVANEPVSTFYNKPLPAKPERQLSEINQVKNEWEALEREHLTKEDGSLITPALPWKAKEYGMMKTLLTKFKAAGGDFEGFMSVMRYTLSNWVAVTLSIKVNCPKPSLPLFVSCFKSFQEAERKLELLADKSAQYDKFYQDQKQAAKFKRIRQTGAMSPGDQKRMAREVRKEVKKEFKETPAALSNDDKLALMMEAQTALQTKKEELEELPPVYEYDDEGMPIIKSLDISHLSVN